MGEIVKRSVIGYCVAFGNMFLAHGLFFVFDGLSLLFYVLQLALNIVLYFAVLKKQFEPVEERKPLHYFLLGAIACVVWTCAYFIFIALVRSDIIELNLGNEANYPEILLGFLPMFLMFIIPVSMIYYVFFRKRVGELFYFYTLSISLVATVPLVFVITLYPYD